MEMHRIRLRHPWEKQIQGASAASSVAVPEPASEPNDSASQAAPATYCRSFHRPTGLERTSTVMLRISNWQGQLESLQLNEQTLPCPQGPPLEIDITAWLASRNQLLIYLVPQTDEPVRLSGEVELAIMP